MNCLNAGRRRLPIGASLLSPLFVSVPYLLLAIVFGCAIQPVWGQGSGTTGALTGAVIGTNGSALPEVAIRLTSAATGTVQSATSDADGHYGFPALPPGAYGLQMVLTGFKTAYLQEALVNVSEETVVSAVLEAGDSADPVTCRCTVARSGSTSSGSVMDSKAITATPLTSRNITQTFVTAAGAAGNVNNAGLLGNSNQSVNVNGQSAGNFTVDGTRSTAAPNPDAVSQFRIQTTQYDSGYGARVPTTNLVTRSGTNDLHGVLFEFVRNNMFNANDYFSKLAGQPKPDLKQNQFGGSLGGRIKKDRLFFFASYQGTRQVNGLDPTSHSTINLPPLTDDRTAQALGAQFGLVSLGNNRYASCANPGTPLTGQIRNRTFAGGTQVACDGSNINPVALRVLQMKQSDGSYLVPTPQKIQGNGLGRSSYSLSSHWGEDQYLGNVDYVISPRHTIAGRFLYANTDQMRTFGASGGGNGYVPGAPQVYGGSDYIASLRLSTSITKNLVNEARANYSRSRTLGTGPGIPTATSLGIVPVNPFFDEVPQMVVQGSLGSFQFFGNMLNDVSSRTTVSSWSDNLSWLHGRHNLRTGFYMDREDSDRRDVGQTRGKITFQNFTDFLLGLNAASNGSPEGLSNIDAIQASEGAGPRGEILNRRRTISAAAYVEDSIKLFPRFTLNLGVRGEWLAPTYDIAGQMGDIYYTLASQVPLPPPSGTYVGVNVPSTYDPNTINPHTGQPFGPVPAGVLVRPYKHLYQNNAPIAFAPRISLAWQPGNQGRFTIRAGYGQFFQASTNNTFNQAPFSQDFANSSSTNDRSSLTKPFPTTTLGFPLRTPTSQFSHRVAGPEYTVGTVHQWNMNIQTTIVRNVTWDIGYVGSAGRHLHTFQSRSLNQPLLASPGHPVNCGLPTTAAGLGVSSQLFAQLGIDSAGCVTTNTSKNAFLRVPILGETPNALALNDDFRDSEYNGLQTTLRKTTSNGLTVQASYTFSKAMSNTAEWLNDQYSGRSNWGPTNRAHRVVFSYSYEIPQPGGLGWMSDKLLSGWSVSGVTSVQSGSPLTLTDRSAGSVYGRTGNATITMCPGASYTDLVTKGKESTRINQWFNTTGVICPASVVGSDLLATGYGTAGRGFVTGPGQHDWDISFSKTTQVGGLREDAQLQFRAEFYNAFNHPQFADPGVNFGSTSSFGIITQTSVAPRLIQFGLKYAF